MVAHKPYGVSTGEGAATAIRQLPSATLSSERAHTSGSDIVSRQCALFGDSMDDEQWSNNLSKTPSHSTTGPGIEVVGKH